MGSVLAGIMLRGWPTGASESHDELCVERVFRFIWRWVWGVFSYLNIAHFTSSQIGITSMASLVLLLATTSSNFSCLLVILNSTLELLLHHCLRS